MDKLVLDHDKHIEFILSQPSGNHMFNEIRAKEWISRLAPKMQQFGQMFNDNIQYNLERLNK
jgi:hypothetical protein